MIPNEGEYIAQPIRTVYRDGQIVIEYKVLVPDRTRSGDFRHEFVTVEFHGVSSGAISPAGRGR